ncbi:MAG TPA: phosphate signaling complex protein PhoU [Polyangiaceae bacterium]|nr:phosphate signaling complex protein PhoU [Polyangiaceae bacterium]
MPLPTHTSRDFETELRELRAHALAMGARCERSVGLALEAFYAGSHELALQVEALDDQIDRDEMDIDALVLRILALRQPVAYDLRFLAAALKLVTDLERIGDEAVNIAERSIEDHGDAKEIVLQEIKGMGLSAQEMLREALTAFVDGDVARAEKVLEKDDEVDTAYGAIMRAMSTYMATHSQDVPAGLRVVKVAKYLERIADHATNVAEEVIFMVRGEDIRHHRGHTTLQKE